MQTDINSRMPTSIFQRWTLAPFAPWIRYSRKLEKRGREKTRIRDNLNYVGRDGGGEGGGSKAGRALHIKFDHSLVGRRRRTEKGWGILPTTLPFNP